MIIGSAFVPAYKAGHLADLPVKVKLEGGLPRWPSLYQPNSFPRGTMVLFTNSAIELLFESECRR
jgi:hypothetical protein